LTALTQCARTGEGNLLDLSIKAMRVRATVGEVSGALEEVWGRYRATSHTIAGVYGAAFERDPRWQALKEEVDAFAAAAGRRPRMLIAKLGQDGHDRGAKVVATAFADLGFDIDIGPLFQTPEEAGRQAIENDCHAIGVSTLAAGHKTLVPKLVRTLREQGADDIAVFVGGVVPVQDYQFLRQAGVEPDEYVLYDGSGLSRENLVTPQAIIRLLTYASQQPWGTLLKDSLPVAGVDGSLSERFKLGPASGRVHAKTGSLGHVNALSGYATTLAGENVVFTVLVNNHNLATRRALETIDKIVEAIVTSK